LVQEALGAIAGDAGTQARDLLSDSWFVFNASWNIRPGTVLLTKWDIVSADATNDIARLPRKRFRTVARKTWTCEGCN